MHTDEDTTQDYRQQAIADGDLVDVTDQAKEAGFKIPVAFSVAAWQVQILDRAQLLGNGVTSQLQHVFRAVQHRLQSGHSEAICNRMFALSEEQKARRADENVSYFLEYGPDDFLNPRITVVLDCEI